MLSIITNTILLDCVKDEPLEDRTVVVEDGVIKDIYLGTRAIPSEAIVINVGK